MKADLQILKIAERELAEARGRLLGVLKAKAALDAKSRDENLRVLRACLAEKDIVFTEEVNPEEPQLVLRGDFSMRDGPVVSYQWGLQIAEEGALMLCYFPIRMPPKVRASISEFLMYANVMLPFGKLVVALNRTGDVMFQHYVPSEVIVGNPAKAAEQLFESPAQILTYYAPGILAVLSGVSPRQAFEDCGQDDDDEQGEVVADENTGGGEELVDENTNGGEDGVAADEHDGEVGTSSLSPLAKDYSLEGLNIKGLVQPGQVVAAVRQFRESQDRGEDAPRMNILLSGPSGAGKTEFVKYLARAARAELVVARVSDVIRPQVGVTEMRLAALFRQARNKRCILFLDEIDSLLGSRERAEHSWELTQVNELLQQMEQFDGVLVAATNFVKSLDLAVQRRFTFKLAFDYLDEKGREIFFGRYFQMKLTPAERARLRAMDKLTPGDFRTVRQSQYYLIEHPTSAQRLDGLEAEMVARGGGKPQIGF